MRVSWLVAAGAAVILASGGCVLGQDMLGKNPVLAPVPEEARIGSQIINADLIRVGISSNNMKDQEYPVAQVSANGPFHVFDEASKQLIFEGVSWETVSVTVDKNGFEVLHQGRRVGGKLWAGPIRFEPGGDPGSNNVLLRIPDITRKGSVPSYRGALEVVHGYSGPNKLSTVNVLSLQDYLKAVVPNELPPSYGLEADRAQAIAARNYALHPREKPWPQFDICDSQYCQAYYGAQTETAATTQALADTEGLVALYNGELALALYSSSNGGWQEAYENSFSDPITNQFPGTPIPYLKGGPDMPYKKDTLRNEADARAFWTHGYPGYDTDSPYARWSRTWTASELTNTINAGLLDVSTDDFTKPFIQPLFQKGQHIGQLKDIHVDRRGVSGKAMQVTISGTNGVWIIQKEFLIRRILKKNNRWLPSANVIFSHLTNAKGHLIGFKAEGGGFGHGVGMSQLGASWMGRHGYAFPQIIEHYYQGVRIGSIPLHPQRTLPIQTTFYVASNHGTLHVAVPGESAGPTLTLYLNEQKITLDTSKTKTLDVGRYLHAGEINTLRLEPVKPPLPVDDDSPSPIRVWIELL